VYFKSWSDFKAQKKSKMGTIELSDVKEVQQDVGTRTLFRTERTHAHVFLDHAGDQANFDNEPE
jgi:hypothetical protein